MCVGLFGAMLLSASYVGNLVIIGRLTGSFAELSYITYCSNQQENVSITATSSNRCPLGIDLNSFNYDRLHR